MQLRNKILSHILLVIYLLVVVFQNVSQSPDLEDAQVPETSHEHENFTDVHHEHKFHVGVFHILGHLFEKIINADDLADDHLLVVQKSSTKKVIDQNSPVNSYIYGENVLVFEVDAESLPAPPSHLSIFQKLKLPNTPLRAPPSLV